MKRAIALAVLLVVTAAAAANAGSITINNWNYGHTGSLTRNGVTQNNIVLGSATLTNPTGGLENYVPNTFVAYCVDLGVNTGTNPHQVDVPPSLMSNWNLEDSPSAGGRYAAWLYNSYRLSADTNVERAGLALAIWEVLYDNNFDLTDDQSSTGFKASADNAVMTQAATYLAAAQAANVSSSEAYWLRLRSATGDESQDFMGPIPEPGSLLLLGVGLLGLATAVRRRR